MMKFWRLCRVATMAVVLASCNSGEEIKRGGNGETGTVDFDRIYEYTPAPGQFVNEIVADHTGGEITLATIVAYAEQRLKNGAYLSLGGFGGYVVAGFDHDILNDGDYNIAIGGNQRAESNEPGVVWVMYDANGNGLPDDEWYEIAGSESGADYASHGTVRGYEVTYYRPTEKEQPVKWSDCMGNSGEIDYLPQYHRFDCYYPEWIAADEYTLRGTRLAARNYDKNAGTEGDAYWINPPYDWGYADNLGSDAVDGGKVAGLPAGAVYTLHKIADAVDGEGRSVHLPSVRFVKIQTAINTKSGWLGEASTEITAIKDYNRIKNR
ncbi:MAG: hypothetical protein ACI35T_03515 [Alistipes sp.]